MRAKEMYKDAICFYHKCLNIDPAHALAIAGQQMAVNAVMIVV